MASVYSHGSGYGRTERVVAIWSLAGLFGIGLSISNRSRFRISAAVPFGETRGRRDVHVPAWLMSAKRPALL